jgi:UDP-N-acetylbacillosamine N-acetyltransferase
MITKAIIVGAFHEIIELTEELEIEIIGLIDNEKVGTYLNYPVLCNDKDASKLSSEYKLAQVIITPDRPSIRYNLSNLYSGMGFNFLSLTSKGAKVSKSAVINIGTIIQHGVNISSEVIIGRFVKLNTFCNIMHDSQIGDFTTIAPNAIVLGNVGIGKSCYIGSNSTILPNIQICDNVIIGAGAVVTKNIQLPGTYFGVPAVIK